MDGSDDAVKVLKFLRLEDQPEKADAIFVLGEACLAPINRAAELYFKNYAPYISFTSIGGTYRNKAWGVPEYVKYREVLNNLGIPVKSMLSIGLSTNTLEEARQSIPFLKKNGVNPEKIILVARPVHQRRVWATFAKQWPDIKFINCPAKEDEIELDRLVGEVHRLMTYGAKGDLLQTPIPNNILKIVNRIREKLK